MSQTVPLSTEHSVQYPNKLIAILRIALGWIFLWAFIDKVFGLGFATATEKAWLAGNSPTMGFLKFGTKGPLAGIFQALAGNPIVDWLFMLGLLLIGIALILGIGVRMAGYSGTLMMLLMWLAVFPPENNPIIDEHIMYALIFISFTYIPVGHTWGLGKMWSEMEIVKKYPILQ